MNLPLFIARRIAFTGSKHFSRFIIRIATVAVALSVSVMIVTTALIAGFKSEISRKIFEFWGHIHISDTGYSLSFEPQPVDKRQDFYPSLDTVAHVARLEPSFFLGFPTNNEILRQSRGGIRHIQVFAHKPGIIQTKDRQEGILLKGISTDFDWQNLNPYLLEGHPIQFNDTSASRDVIISRQTADRLVLNVGDAFILNVVKERELVRRRLRVCGIYKTGLEEYDRKFALCDLKQVQELLGWSANEVAGFEVWLDDLRDLDLYNTYIYEEVLPGNMLCVPIREKFPAIFEWLQLQDYNEVVILALMLAVAIINMITAMLVLVLERTRMIGILKALGESNGRIRQIFLYYAAVITLNGMFWGNLIGLGFAFLQKYFKIIRLNEADYYLAYAPIKLAWGPVIGVNIATLAITLVFLVLPSMAVSRVSPIRAIQFK